MKNRGDKIQSSVLETIGNTPVVSLSRITKNEMGKILAKSGPLPFN